MDPNHGLIYMAGAGLTVGLVYKWIRPKFKVGVNCWFCNGNFQIDFGAKNGWNCPGCQQYNGFDTDGGYNKEIPEQHSYQRIPFAVPPKEAKFKHNGFCMPCNRNQGLKIHQLAKFKPKNESTEDQEVEEYAAHLDRTYRLCRTCEALLHQSLGEQEASLKPQLLAWKLERNRQSRKTLHQTKRWSEVPLEFGLVRLVNFILSFLGLLLVALDDANLPYYKRGSFRQEEFNLSTMVQSLRKTMTLADVITAGLALQIISATTSRNQWTIKRKCITFLWTMTVIAKVAETFDLIRPPMSVYSGLMACLNLVSLFYLFSRGSNEPAPAFSNHRPPVNHASRQNQVCNEDETLTQDLVSSTSSINNSFESVHSSLEQTKLPVHDSPCDISTLSLDGDSNQSVFDGDKIQNRHHTFDKRSFVAPNQSGINFGQRSILNKPLLRPSRLQASFQENQVAKSSWVAGGYWQNKRLSLDPNKLDNLSRSSSQSSGFISHCSASNVFGNPVNSLPSSRVNSTAGDALDRLSLLSEPILNSKSQRLNEEISLCPTKEVFQPSRLEGSSKRPDSRDSFLDHSPKARSSPIPKEAISDVKTSLLDRKITVSVSCYAIVLGLSSLANMALMTYVVYSYLVK